MVNCRLSMDCPTLSLQRITVLMALVVGASSPDIIHHLLGPSNCTEVLALKAGGHAKKKEIMISVHTHLLVQNGCVAELEGTTLAVHTNIAMPGGPAAGSARPPDALVVINATVWAKGMLPHAGVFSAASCVYEQALYLAMCTRVVGMGSFRSRKCLMVTLQIARLLVAECVLRATHRATS
jgi:hypothetical protein